MSVPALRFKQDDGREFPKWEATTLNAIAKIVGGGTPDTAIEDYWQGSIQWFTPTELKTKYVSESKRKISDAGLKNSSAKVLPAGTLLLSSRATVGDVSIALNECTTNQGFQSLIVNDENNNEFVYYWLTNNKKSLLEKASGSTFLEISKREIEKLVIQKPVKKEQTKIANFLTAVDEKITQLTQKHDLLTQYKKGVMQLIFSQELRFKDDDGGNFPEWEEKELRTLCDLVTKGTTPTSVGHEFKTSGINFIKIESLEADGKLIKEKLGFIDADAHAKLFRSQLKLHDLLFSIAGALGRVAIVTDEFLPANTNQALAIIRLSEGQSLDTKYVFYTLTNDRIKKLIESISVQLAQANLSLKDIGDFVIELPCIKEQTKIANFLTAIDDKITAIQAQLHAVKQYKHGLLQQMFV